MYKLTEPKLITALEAVLAVGNALNNSTFRGGARGFQLDALLKVCLPQMCVACGGVIT